MKAVLAAVEGPRTVGGRGAGHEVRRGSVSLVVLSSRTDVSVRTEDEAMSNVVAYRACIFLGTVAVEYVGTDEDAGTDEDTLVLSSHTDDVCVFSVRTDDAVISNGVTLRAFILVGKNADGMYVVIVRKDAAVMYAVVVGKRARTLSNNR